MTGDDWVLDAAKSLIVSSDSKPSPEPSVSSGLGFQRQFVLDLHVDRPTQKYLYTLAWP